MSVPNYYGSAPSDALLEQWAREERVKNGDKTFSEFSSVTHDRIHITLDEGKVKDESHKHSLKEFMKDLKKVAKGLDRVTKDARKEEAREDRREEREEQLEEKRREECEEQAQEQEEEDHEEGMIRVNTDHWTGETVQEYGGFHERFTAFFGGLFAELSIDDFSGGDFGGGDFGGGD